MGVITLKPFSPTHMLTVAPDVASQLFSTVLPATLLRHIQDFFPRGMSAVQHRKPGQVHL